MIYSDLFSHEFAHDPSTFQRDSVPMTASQILYNLCSVITWKLAI